MWIFRKPEKADFTNWQGYLVSIFLVIAVTGTGIWWTAFILPQDILVLYFAALVPTAIFFGLGPSILFSIIGVTLYDFCFVPPYFTEVVPGDWHDFIMYVLFLSVSLTISLLASNLRRETRLVINKSQLLEKSEARYRSLVDNANEAIIVFQGDNIKFFNNKAVEVAGYSRADIASKSIFEFIYPDDMNYAFENYRKVIDGEIKSATGEMRLCHGDGGVRWVLINGVQIEWEHKPALLGLISDITERKSMEDELKAYSQKITQVQEEERKRIAVELHDDTAQYLALLKLEIDSLLQSGKITDPDALNKLNYLEIDAGRAVNDVRRYSHELRPGVLEHLGLQTALEQIAEDINKSDQFTILIECEGEEPEVPEDIKLGLFRIAQEAINNARKHSLAAEAIIRLLFKEDQIQMEVIDRGIGFDLQEVKHHPSLKGNMGLVSMQERAKLIGAQLKIESTPQEGTKITVKKYF